VIADVVCLPFLVFVDRMSVLFRLLPISKFMMVDFPTPD
ncbi:uncharacterized protein METZ01_LOCUS43416, partial [marine metagenome]